ncbi:MAG: NYN domain-containing protein [Nitriliruptoraceae bacterium]
MTDLPDPVHLDAARLEALDPDTWAAVLVALRAELTARDEVDGEVAGLRNEATSRLVAGPGRRRAAAALAEDPGLAAGVLARLSSEVLELVRATPSPPPDRGPSSRAHGGRDDRLRAEVERAKERAREFQDDRDRWRRRAEGAETRAARLEAELASARAEAAAAAAEIERREAELADAADARERAVARERRRRDGEVARLEEAIVELRRAEEERRVTARRQEEAARSARPTPAPSAPADDAPVGLEPGRPTPLPDGLSPATTEGARALLGPGRLVLVDGYNVTRQHRGDQDLEGQRTWLIQRLATAVAVRGIRPVIVFDGQRAGGGRPLLGHHKVEVRFTASGITADDEIVFAVAATDEPVVVVTDDRELQDRVMATGADVVPTTAFLGAVRG